MIVDMSILTDKERVSLRIVTEFIHENNIAPAGWRVMTEKEFAKSDFFLYIWNETEYRQLHATEEGLPVAAEWIRGKSTLKSVMLTVRLFKYNHRSDGYAMGHSQADGRVYYFHWGCDHKTRELSRDECMRREIPHYGRRYHAYECIVCGDISAYDSSD